MLSKLVCLTAAIGCLASPIPTAIPTATSTDWPTASTVAPSPTPTVFIRPASPIPNAIPSATPTGGPTASTVAPSPTPTVFIPAAYTTMAPTVGSATFAPSSAPTYAVPADGDCMDATNETNPLCYKNVLWAMETGISAHPQWYAKFPGLTADSSFGDFQYALYRKRGPGDGPGWNCTKPCTYSVEILPGLEVAPNVNAAGGLMSKAGGTTTAGPATSSGSSFPWWAWCLLAALLVCLCGTAALVVSMLSGGKKRGPSKKKRATNVTPTPAPASVAEPYMPTAQLAQPATTYAAPPGYTAVPTVAPVPMQYAAAAPVEQRSVQMAPMVATLPPIATANGAYAPVSMQAPAPMALPIVQPMVQPSAQPATNLFDRLDSNHDGTISRAEFAALGFR